MIFIWIHFLSCGTGPVPPSNPALGLDLIVMDPLQYYIYTDLDTQCPFYRGVFAQLQSRMNIQISKSLQNFGTESSAPGNFFVPLFLETSNSVTRLDHREQTSLIHHLHIYLTEHADYIYMTIVDFSYLYLHDYIYNKQYLPRRIFSFRRQ